MAEDAPKFIACAAFGGAKQGFVFKRDVKVCT